MKWYVGKNGIAKYQLGELGILEKMMVHQLSVWLKVEKCIRVEEGRGLHRHEPDENVPQYPIHPDSMFYSLSCFPVPPY